MNNILKEGNLSFDFTHCGTPVKFDESRDSGLNAVDFIAENDRCIYFIEVKDYQNPNTPHQQQLDDYRMLLDAGIQKESIFIHKMGGKIKDSLLRIYAEGGAFSKRAMYLLFINLDRLSANERGKLKLKMYGHIPTGLNNKRFSAFEKISFKLVDARQLRKYGIVCTENPTT
jgi:hypothetical protein